MICFSTYSHPIFDHFPSNLRNTKLSFPLNGHLINCSMRNDLRSGISLICLSIKISFLIFNHPECHPAQFDAVSGLCRVSLAPCCDIEKRYKPLHDRHGIKPAWGTPCRASFVRLAAAPAWDAGNETGTLHSLSVLVCDGAWCLGPDGRFGLVGRFVSVEIYSNLCIINAFSCVE